jgi:hypothetical protein
VGYDGSDGGRKAFDVALALSAKHGAELWIVTVAQPPAIGDEVETEAVLWKDLRWRLLIAVGFCGEGRGCHAGTQKNGWWSPYRAIGSRCGRK